MKKLFLILPVFALAACGQDYSKYDSIFGGCERIETTDFHLVYKCPAGQEWAQKVKQLKPNGKFRAGGHLNLSELYADKEHVYTEVSFDDPGTCKEDFTIRTMIAEPVDGDAGKDINWAFIGCR
ncbi:MAG: hypothetical protein IKN73_03190 [Alphaproteobacteria bacterium]|nr:hypothetical protein [Alphaproteobacteria bacterium]